LGERLIATGMGILGAAWNEGLTVRRKSPPPSRDAYVPAGPGQNRMVAS